MELHDLLPSLKAMLAAIPCPHPWGEHYRRTRVMALSCLILELECGQSS